MPGGRASSRAVLGRGISTWLIPQPKLLGPWHEDREDAIPPGFRRHSSMSLRYQQNLERLVSLLHHLKAFLVLLQRKLMGHDAFGRNAAIRDPRNHEGILVRAKMDSQHIQLFPVRYDAPIDGHIVREHTELDEPAQLTDHL